MSEEKFNFMALQLVFVFLVVYLGQVFTGFNPGFNAAESPWWKFFTSFFGHGSMEHLFNNAFFIALFGSIYERLTSQRMFLKTFFVSAVIANLSAFIFFPETTVIGASGGAMGVLAALAVYRPRKPGLALGVPAPMWSVLIAYAFIDVVGLSAATTGVAHEAHLLGMVAGVFIGYRLRDEPFLSQEEEEDIEYQWRQRIKEWEEKWMLD